MLRPIQDLLGVALATLAGWTGSVGVGVVLMTVLIRVALHPLTRWSLKSMKRMQALAPQIEVLRRKHKENPAQANQEIMSLYRTSGVNPFGGCLPTLIQIPVLIALYRVFTDPVIFKGQTLLGLPLDIRPGFSAIAQDPVLLLIPMLVGVTTYFQQSLSITDPQQAKLFLFMPIMVAWFSLSFPVGLSLYWIASTVVYIAEYFLVVGRPRRAARGAPRPGGPRAAPGEKPRARA